MASQKMYCLVETSSENKAMEISKHISRIFRIDIANFINAKQKNGRYRVCVPKSIKSPEYLMRISYYAEGYVMRMEMEV